MTTSAAFDAVIRSVKTVNRWRCAARTALRIQRLLLMAMLWIAVVALIDRLTALPTTLRTVSLLTLLSGVAVYFYRIRKSAIVDQAELMRAAEWMEHRKPDFDGRLDAVVTQHVGPTSRPSMAMTDRLSEQIVSLCRSGRLLMELRLTLLRVTLVCASLVALWVVAARVEAFQLRRLLARQLMPFSAIEPATTTRITPEQGSFQLKETEPAEVSVQVRNGDGRVVLEIGVSPQSLQAVAMNDVGGGRYRVTVPSVFRNQTYRIRAGDAVTRFFQITLLPKPTPRSLTATIEETNGVAQDLLNGNARLLAGQSLRLRLTSDNNLRRATVAVGAKQFAFARDGAGDDWSARVTIDREDGALLTLVSQDGVTSQTEVRWRLTASESGLSPATSPSDFDAATEVYLRALRQRPTPPRKAP